MIVRNFETIDSVEQWNEEWCLVKLLIYFLYLSYILINLY
jgi:hypothetical protein